ncbi:hypothetical protein EII14_00725 [Alloprevotella sp. OH1205_COT-284]|uniref:hypothetical protein n=1 Tax=Alloprevotella sp. OH1205_COT-284 TaxID=2491043 RepID=UPI000F5FF58C|nr:hypothetical protein [Alloprevotella sp. OH1205_COT-284]RRD80862.1 hypothetical protein EII14_00725 [Alloprevotella sp. OH1205_COT-284]
MRERTFRHRVVNSVATLPVVAVVGALLWVLPDFKDHYLWGGLLVIGAMTYILVECNNRFQLLRIRTQMTAAVFLTLFAVFPELHRLSWSFLPVVCLQLCYVVLFNAYGEHEPQGLLFHAFLFLSLGAFVFPPLLLLLPFLVVSIHVQLRALSFKGLLAGFLGLLLPLWIYLPVLLREGRFNVSELLLWWNRQLPRLSDYSSVPLAHGVGWGILVFLGLISILHFLSTSYNDKIRTRQYFYFLLVQEFPLVALTLLYPHAFSVLFPLLILNNSPFIAHYFALARGRGLNFWFCLWLSVVMMTGVANYFDLWNLFCNFL